MAYYTALIAAWNGATQPPTGVTGTALTGGMTTAQKLAAVNAWTVTGSVPSTIFVTGNQVLNCIDFAEFNALTAAKQTNMLQLCAVPGLLLGGSANTAKMLAGMNISYFPSGGPTIVALTALSQGAVQPWWQANSYFGPINNNDLVAAGGLT